ncbi:MAG TPA: hypothetical protein VFG07_10320, partial [Thermoplasmata archaeon]|nr:hypothetical protein [Thermoplasmata archaeon]
MPNNPNDEGIGLLSGEEAQAAAKPAVAVPEKAPAPTPAPVVPKPEAPGLLELQGADEGEREVTAGNVVTISAVLTSRHPEPGTARVGVEIAYTSTYPGEGAEWPVSWLLPSKRSFSELVARSEKANVALSPGTPAPIAFQITAPVGVRYGDRVEIRLTAQWPDNSRPARLTLACVARQAVLAIKSSRGYEREVADTLHARAEEKRDVVFALLVPAALRGYVFAEGMSF